MQLLAKFIISKERLTLIQALSLTSNGWLNTYFVIDTGATTSLFCPEVGKLKNGCDKVSDLNGSMLTAKRCNAVLSLAGKTMKIEGSIIDYDTLPNVDGKHLSGILGVDFFLKNHLVLDFFHEGIYLKEMGMDDTMNLPSILMNLGLDGYRIPAILLNCNDRQLPFALDTGATNNIVVPEISYSGKEVKRDAQLMVKGLINQYVAKECELRFSIYLSCKGKVVKHEFIDVFTFMEDVHPTENSLILNTFHGIIGNDFIQRQKWVIDFADRKIYEKLE